VDNGSRLRLAGEGDAGLRGGPPGELYVVLYVKPHKIFERSDGDLLSTQPISFVQAALGAEVDVPTLEGTARLKIPSGTQTHTVFRLRGKGMPRLNQYGRGDELVRIVIQTPTKLTPSQRKILEEFGKEKGEAPQNRSFFD